MLNLDIKLSRKDFRLNAVCDIDRHAVGLYGPSGSGKSTLLNCIAGLETPDSGRIVLNGRTVFDGEKKINVPAHKRNIGIVFQDSLLFPHYSVRGNLEYGRKKLSNNKIKYDLEEIADILEISHLLDSDVCTLSGGERQRVAIGRAILSEPDILLLDEPFAAIDNNLTASLLGFIQLLHLRTSVPFVIVSHVLDEILYLTDYLVLIDKGNVVAAGHSHELVVDPAANKYIEYNGFTNTFRMVTSEHRLSSGVTCYSIISDNDKFLRIRLKAPLCTDHQRGQIVHASLNSTDIALSLAPVEYISIQNQMPGYIAKIVNLPGKCVAIIDIGIKLIVDITPSAIYDLELLPGQKVWCLFKSQAMSLLPNRLRISDDKPSQSSRTISFTMPSMQKK